MAVEWVTPGYMAEFVCIGAECEDTCCQSWDVHYDKPHYDILIASLSDNPQRREEILKHIHISAADTRKSSNYALIQFGNERYCPFLTTEKWCEIQRDFGVTVLSNICAFYPRVISQHGLYAEMTGALSCPEVVRRCFSEAASSDWIRLDSKKLPRTEDLPFARSIDADTTDLYRRNFPRVRDCMLELLQQEDYVLETRLFFLASFTHRLASNYHLSGECNEELLATEINRMQDVAVLESLYDFYNGYSSDEPIAIIVIQSILQLQRQQMQGSGLEKMISEIFNHYAQLINTVEPTAVGVDNLPPAKLHEQFALDWHLVNTQWGAVLDDCLSRYVRNCLQREWFVSMPDPFVYVHLLTLRVAVLKFLITANKSMRDFMQLHQHRSVEERTELAEAFIEEVVAVTYQFARGIDQNLALLQVVYDALAEQQMMSFDYSLALIKF